VLRGDRGSDGLAGAEQVLGRVDTIKGVTFMGWTLKLGNETEFEYGGGL